MITILLSNSYGQILNLTDESVIRELRNQLSYYVPGYEFSQAFKRGVWSNKLKKYIYWDGKKYLFTETNRFPSGLCYMVENVFKKHKLEWKLDDRRTQVELGEPIPVKTINPYPYQKIILEKALKEGGGVIQVATGGGKSAICCMIAGMLNVKTIIYVHTKDLLYQMKDNVERLLDIRCGQMGDGIIDIQKITVATIQTAYRAFDKKYSQPKEEAMFTETLDIKRYKKDIIQAIGSANLVFFDECHRLISETFQFISRKSKLARYKYALSATAFRDDDCDILVSAACGKKIANVSASYLIENEYLVKPYIYMYNVPRPQRHYRDYHKAYDEYIVENVKRNAIIHRCVNKAIENKKHVLILVQKLKHGEALYDLLKDKHRVVYLRGENSSIDRKHAIDAMKDGDIDCIIASTIFDEGVDIPILDTLILAGGGKSKVRALQRIGRVLRKYKHKERAIVIDFVDNATYLIKHSKARKEIYKTERLFVIKEQNG